MTFSIRSSFLTLCAASLLLASPLAQAESLNDQRYALDLSSNYSASFFSPYSSFSLSPFGRDWFRNALWSPASTRIQPTSLLSANTSSVMIEADYVGTLRNEYNADVAQWSSPMYRPVSGTLTGPITPDAINTAKVWDGGTTGAGLSWTATSGVNWNPDGVPASGDTLTLDNSIVNIPTTMQVGANLGALSVTFANNFNPTNTTTIGSNVSGSPIFTFDSGWSLTNNATSGSVTFNPNVSSTGPLSFKLNGAGTVTVASGGTINWNTVIADGVSAGAITKAGAGTLTLGAANTYTGGTTVNVGILRVTNTTGSATGAGTVTVSNAGTFLAGGTTTGVGGISGPVNINTDATISPGTSGNGVGTTAILNTGALTLASGSHYALDLNSGTLGTGYDQLAVTGTVTVTGALLDITLGSGFTPTTQTFVIVSNDGVDPVIGAFSATSVLPPGYVLDYFYDAGTGNLAGGNDIALVPVPEASTWMGAALALAAVGYTQRRKLRGLIATRA